MNTIAFGPVPSRRLGQSLGINNIPPKICSYSCVYCQVGRTSQMQIQRETFYPPEELVKVVGQQIREATARGESIDYLTFVSDGEPTLDLKLGREIEFLKSEGVKIAVITNSSLLWREDVRQELLKADWVSVKVDAATQDIWHKIDRPHGTLQLQNILQGVSDFSQDFTGELITETMLVNDVNDRPEELERIAGFIAELGAHKSYLSIPTRPPAEEWVSPATEHGINLAYQIFRGASLDVEYLIGYEGNEFAFTGNAVEDLLSITSVHPMREDAVQAFLDKAQRGWELVEKLLAEKQLLTLEYRNNIFYMRAL